MDDVFLPKKENKSYSFPGEWRRGSLIEPGAISIVGKNWRQEQEEEEEGEQGVLKARIPHLGQPRYYSIFPLSLKVS